MTELPIKLLREIYRLQILCNCVFQNRLSLCHVLVVSVGKSAKGFADDKNVVVVDHAAVQGVFQVIEDLFDFSFNDVGDEADLNCDGQVGDANH